MQLFNVSNFQPAHTRHVTTLLHLLTFQNTLPCLHQAGEREKVERVSVFSKNCATFELHQGVRTSATESRFLYLPYPFGACRRRNLSAASVGL